jgi:tRNA threonylcarbamoyladenosine biosynthesis protein TsaB
MNNILLAVDAATEHCSVALQLNGTIISRECNTTILHSKTILTLIDDVLKSAAISLKAVEAIAFACGPGSFTGVRLAASITQGLAFAQDLPVIAVSTLKALAQAAVTEYRATQVLAALDARMQEVYWGVYRLEKNILIKETEIVCSPQNVPMPPPVANNWIAIGKGWQTYGEALQLRLADQKIAAIYAEHLPHAKYILALAQQQYDQQDWLNAADAIPNYIRDQVTHQK